ncbi:MAG: SMC-Scp complex subunit ScpB [Myxococcota bacterium]
MKPEQQRQIVEALILAAPEPIAAARIGQIVPGLNAAKAKKLVEELKAEYVEQGRGFELWEVAGGYQLRTRPDLAGWVKQLQKDRPVRLSRAALETLAVVAYKQPATRAEVEQVRGVDVGPVLRSLVDRSLVRIAGHREVPGRPILYGTTKRFLEVFGLTKLDDLPSLRDVEELMREQLDGDADASDEESTAGSPEFGEGSALESGEGLAATEPSEEVPTELH